MNEDTVAGKLKSVSGKIKQATGEAIGNQELANAGVADRVKGAAQETWGTTKDAAHDVGTAIKRDSETHQTANTLRDKVTGVAEHVKEFFSEATDQVRGKVHEHELDRDGREVHQVH